MIPLYCVHTESHAALFGDWFLPSLSRTDPLDLRVTPCHATTGGSYRDPAWSRAIITKSDVILRAIRENHDRVFVYSDVDVQFFAPMLEPLLDALGDGDIALQRDDRAGMHCTGFFVARGSDRLVRFWERVRAAAVHEGRDQRAFQEIVADDRSVRVGRLPEIFFGAGLGIPQPDDYDAEASFRLWEPGDAITIPEGIVLHHANWTIGQEHKLAQLAWVADAVRTRDASATRRRDE